MRARGARLWAAIAALASVVAFSACSGDDDETAPAATTTTVAPEALPPAVLAHGPFFFVGDVGAAAPFVNLDRYTRALVPDGRTYAFADSGPGTSIWFVGPTIEGVDIVWIEGAHFDREAGEVETAFFVEEAVSVGAGMWLLGDGQMAHVTRSDEGFEIDNVVGIGGQFVAAVSTRRAVWVANDQGELIEFDSATGEVLRSLEDLDEDPVVDLDVDGGDLIALTARGHVRGLDLESLAWFEIDAPEGTVEIAVSRRGDALAFATGSGDVWARIDGKLSRVGGGLTGSVVDLAVRTEGGVRVIASSTTGVLLVPPLD